MTEHELPFSREEYAHRVARTREAMFLRGIDLLVVTDPSNMAWLTGYDGWSFYVHQCVVLGPEGEPVWWGRNMDLPGARRTVTMTEESLVGYDDTYVQNPQQHPMEALAALIQELGWEQALIGVELDNYYYSAAAHATLVKFLPEARFYDATGWSTGSAR